MDDSIVCGGMINARVKGPETGTQTHSKPKRTSKWRGGKGLRGVHGPKAGVSVQGELDLISPSRPRELDKVKKKTTEDVKPTRGRVPLPQ